MVDFLLLDCLMYSIRCRINRDTVFTCKYVEELITRMDHFYFITISDLASLNFAVNCKG